MQLCKLGYELILVGRDEQRCRETESQLRSINPEARVQYFVADLSSRKEVLELANSIKSKVSDLDVLVNNAGAVFVDKHTSADGIEMTMALNHFGYYWLTMELLDLLRKSNNARIINVSSAAHKRAQIKDIDSIENSFDLLGYMAYGNSKLANLWFTFELSKQLELDGITVNALHPGLVATRFGKNNGLMGIPLQILMSFLGISSEQGAKTIVHLVDSPELEGKTNGYYFKCKLIESSKLSRNEMLSKMFFEFSQSKTQEIDAGLAK